METIESMIYSGLAAQIQCVANGYQRERGCREWRAQGGAGTPREYAAFVAFAVDYEQCVRDACAACGVTDPEVIGAVCSRLC